MEQMWSTAMRQAGLKGVECAVLHQATRRIFCFAAITSRS
jgi:hypothetical protein